MIRNFLILIFLIFISCNDSLIRNNRQEVVRDIENYIKANDIDQAVEILKYELQNDIDDYNLNVLYSICLYKQSYYQSCLLLTEKLIEDSENFSKTPELVKKDLLFYNLNCAIKTDKYDNFEKNFKIYDSFKSEPVDEVKISIIKAVHDIRSSKYLEAVEDIVSVLKKYKINDEITSNLLYLKAIALFNAKRYDSTLETISTLTETELKNGEVYLTKELLDKLVSVAEDDFISSYRQLIINNYKNLESFTSDLSFSGKINRSINLLDPQDVSISLDTKFDDLSALTLIKILPDYNKTSVVFGSNDSIVISNTRYDKINNNLNFSIVNKNFNSEKNFLTPPDGVGIKSFSWRKNESNIDFSILFDGDYEVTFENLSDYFEKNRNASDRHQLLLSVYLPVDESPDNLLISHEDDKFTIVLDPGHGGDDPGAMSVMKKPDGSRYTEKEMNLLFCRELKEELERIGYRVFLTRDRDIYPSLPERNRIAQKRNANMFISIHMNSTSTRHKKKWQTDAYAGAELIIRKSIGEMPSFINKEEISKEEWLKERKQAMKEHYKLSEILSETIQSCLKKPFNQKRKMIKKNLAIFSGMNIPHALIEAGYIINNDNLNYFLNEDGRKDLYKGIIKGIEKYRKSSN
ncbi:MAG: N-acetylmuramoyl-L-alanine amidase [Candidatus Delongbacteria bacterium]|nr:N-acetylmuramoyl-L-alanine amidase [Candidatus Delongbacteria bacterium]MBN2836372.1 N-acetylmuramoyl-L-alanine amidase [Candidatus Delongbacteria bacterium]